MCSSNLFQKIKKRLLQKQGFTFTELLATTVIILLSTGLVVQCVDIAKEQYGDRTLDSEAQLLVTSLSDAIQDHLQYASEVKLLGDAEVSETPQVVTSFHSDRIGKSGNFSVNGIQVANDGNWNDIRGQITFVDSDNISHELVSDTAYKADSSVGGGLVAAMMMTYYKNSEGIAEFHPTVWVYADGGSRVLAKKSFVVGKAYAVDDSEPEQKTYTVTFNSNGGTLVDSQTVVDGGHAIKPTSPPTKYGYTFVEWQKDGVNFDFATPITSDVTLTANWTENIAQHFVIFYPRNMESSFSRSVETDGKLSEKNIPEDPKLTSYTFQGWYSDLEGAQNLTADKVVDLRSLVVSDDNVNLYAGWKKNDVGKSGNMSIDSNGGRHDYFSINYDENTKLITLYYYRAYDRGQGGGYGNKITPKNENVYMGRSTIKVQGDTVIAVDSNMQNINLSGSALKWTWTGKTFEATNSKNQTLILMYKKDDGGVDSALHIVDKSRYETEKSKWIFPSFKIDDFKFDAIDNGL